ncbi:hypothetical protein ACTXT7_016672 [Hymenolepis weldensis]
MSIPVSVYSRKNESPHGCHPKDTRFWLQLKDITEKSQAILAEATRDLFLPEYQEHLVSIRVIAKTHPPILQAHLKPLERAGMGNSIKTANALDNCNYPLTSPRPWTHNQERGYLPRNSRPARATQSEFEAIPMCALNSGTTRL